MAKKRVNELAREYDLPSKVIIERLKKAGIEVKAQATAIDEDEAKAAITGKPLPGAAKNGAAKKQQPPPRPGVGPLGRGPLGAGPLGRGDGPATRPSQQQRPSGQQGKPGAQPQARGGDQPGGQPPADGQKGADGTPRRPTRSSLQGERNPQAAGGRRRVVIDSQASRRQGAGGPPKPPLRQNRGRGRRRRGTYEEPTPQDTSALKPDVIRVNSGSTVKDVAEYLGVSTPEVIKKLMTLGEMATLTQTLSDDAIQVLADEFDKQIEIVTAADEVADGPAFEDADEDLVTRPPVVTIMGHVDHGKTSLLDAIRETEVAAGEAGGITQHIGAYQVHHDERVITFLDTPGHEAFTAMRARGAQVTDIAVIVVAADDGVKPQTKEAIDHAKAAEVPILVAVNKIDKEGADPTRTRTEVTNEGLQPVEWGGDTEFVDVSAKTRQGLDDLLETILLMADVEDLKANPATEASGVVIESKLDPGRGAVVTVLVSRGTMKIGDAVVAGAHWGRVRAMSDYKGERVKEAVPAIPSRCSGSTRSRRPASTSAWSRTTARRGRLPASARRGSSRSSRPAVAARRCRWRASSTAAPRARRSTSTWC